MNTSPRAAAPALCLFALALGLPLAALASGVPRFVAEATLAPTQRQVSSNGRFELTAALSATHPDSGTSDGRVELRATLASNATNAVCGPLSDELFSDGFE